MPAKGWDYVVIGAGAAGCVVAGRLSQMLPEARIALIEAGRERLGVTTKVPGIAFIASTFPRQNWNYQTEPVPALNGRRLSWFQGRILGGSSSINGMLYLRGHSLEYDQWAQRGCQGWSFDQVLPYFKKAETNSRGAGEWHGDDGPMAVKQSRLDLPICDAFLAAAGEAGYPVVDDLNTDVVEGFGRIDTNIAQRPPRQHRGGLRAGGTAARQSRPAVGGDRGADRHRGRSGKRRRDHPAGCARDGLGGARGHPVRRNRQLAAAPDAVGCRASRLISPSLGIPVVLDAPEVGRNLQNHPAYSLRYACSQPVTAYKYLNPGAAIGMGLRYALTGGGSLAESYVATGGYMRSDPSLAVSDTIVVMIPALVTRRAEIGFRLRDMFPERHGFTVMVGSGRPLSRGHILLRNRRSNGASADLPGIFLRARRSACPRAVGAADARHDGRRRRYAT